MKSTFAVAALASVAAAIPTHPQTCPRTSQNANFDDLEGGLPGSIVNPIPTPYKGLLFQGITYTTVINTGTGLQPGIAPHSGANYGAINVLSQLQGTPMITANYPESKISSFQLESFYYACVVQLATGAAAIPTECNINVTGYQGSDNAVAASKQVCSQSYNYNPTTPLAVQQQTFGKFNDCWGKDLQFAVIQFDLTGGISALDALSALVIDDVKFSTVAKDCKKY